MWTFVFALGKVAEWKGIIISDGGGGLCSFGPDLEELSFEGFIQVGPYPPRNHPERQLLNYSHFLQEQTEVPEGKDFVQDRAVGGRWSRISSLGNLTSLLITVPSASLGHL